MASAARPPALPVPIEQVKAYLRIEGSEEDALLAGLVRSATELCEAFTRIALIEREAEETLPVRPAWTRLGQSPVRAILYVARLDAGGAASPLASGDYAVDIDGGGDGWVRLLRIGGGGSAGRLVVRYRAGQASDWNGIAEPLRQGIVRMAVHLYTHRDGASGGAPPAAVTALWLPWRRLRLA
jgi:uncharacterized phiE125 gp8 family phage protein